eukprot:scaffold130514_cov79-Cyclotella_meneghiniana.AAC.9
MGGVKALSKLAWLIPTFDNKIELRFEFIIHNHHHTLWLLSRGCRQDRLQYPLFHTKMVIQDFHIISTYPTSHYKYDKTALPAVQFSRMGSKLAWPIYPLVTSRLSEFGLQHGKRPQRPQPITTKDTAATFTVILVGHS